jgi:hypothetical protein
MREKMGELGLSVFSFGNLLVLLTGALTASPAFALRSLSMEGDD